MWIWGLTVLAVLGGAAPAASAAVGDLVLAGCTTPAGSSCAGASHVRFVRSSPDNTSVYVSSLSSTGELRVDLYRRDPATQTLTFTSCVGPSPCAAPGTTLVSENGAFVVSPDGASLYAFGGGKVVRYARDQSTGGLTFAGCAPTDCSNSQPFAFVMAVAPDSSRVYVASSSQSGGDGITAVNLNRDGTLSIGPRTATIGEVTQIAPTRDGTSVLTLSLAGTPSHTWGVLAEYSVGTDGALSLQQCAVGDPSRIDASCSKSYDQASAAGTLGGLAVSPDGQSIYLSDGRYDANSRALYPARIVTVPRDPATGVLEPTDANGDPRAASCIAPQYVGLPTNCSTSMFMNGVGDAGEIVVSGDGRSVYMAGADVGSRAESGIVVFSRGPDGSLTPQDCFGTAGTQTNQQGSCTDLGGASTFSPPSLEVTADGLSLYEAAGPFAGPATDQPLVAFTRLAPPACASTGETVTTGVTAHLSARCTTPPGHPVTGSAVSAPPGNGSAVAGSQPLAFDYTSNPGYIGSDAFGFTASNDLGPSMPAAIALVVSPPSGPPQCADPGPQRVQAGHSVSIPLRCIPPAGETVTREIVAQPSPDHGSLGPIDESAGRVTFTATAGYAGPESFAFRARDAEGESQPITVALQVVDAPVAHVVAVSGTTSGQTTVTAVVNPRGLDTGAVVIYQATGQEIEQSATITVGADASDHPIQAVLTGLSAGTAYTVKVRATNAQGSTDSESLAFSTPAGAGPPPSLGAPPHAVLTPLRVAPIADDPVVLDGASSTGSSALTYTWDTDVPGRTHVESGSASSLSLRFGAGTHFVRLTVGDARGRTDSATETIVVGPAPVYKIELNPAPPLPGQPFTLRVRPLSPDGRELAFPTGAVAVLRNPTDHRTHFIDGIATTDSSVSSTGDFTTTLPQGTTELRVAITTPSGGTTNVSISPDVESQPPQVELPPLCISWDDPPEVGYREDFHDCTQHNLRYKTVLYRGSPHAVGPEKYEFLVGDPAAIRALGPLAFSGPPAPGIRSEAHASQAVKIFFVTDLVSWDFGNGHTVASEAGNPMRAITDPHPPDPFPQDPFNPHTTYDSSRPDGYTVRFHVDFYRVPDNSNVLNCIGSGDRVVIEHCLGGGPATGLGSSEQSYKIYPVDPVTGPIYVHGIGVDSLDRRFYPVPSQGMLPPDQGGGYRVYQSPPITNGESGIKIGGLEIMPAVGKHGEIWIDRATGYVGPRADNAFFGGFQSRFRLSGGATVPLGALTSPLVISGATQTFENFNGLDDQHRPITVAGLPLFSEAMSPTVTISPGPVPARAVWPLRLPGVLGEHVDNAPGHTETAIPRYVSSDRSTPGGRAHIAQSSACGSDPAAGITSDGDFDFTLPIDIGPVTATLDAHNRSRADPRLFGGGFANVFGHEFNACHDPVGRTGFEVGAGGRLSYAGATYQGAPIHLGPYVQINSIHGQFGQDPFLIAGDADFSNTGPPIIRADGCLAYVYGRGTGRDLPLCPGQLFGTVRDSTDGVLVRASGQLKLEFGVELPIGAGFLQYAEGGGVRLHGELDYGVRIPGTDVSIAGVKGSLDVTVNDWSHWSTWIQGNADLIGLGFLDAGLGLSSQGISGCLFKSILGQEIDIVGFYIRFHGGAGAGPGIGCGTAQARISSALGPVDLRDHGPLAVLGAATSLPVSVSDRGRRVQLAVTSVGAGAPTVSLRGPDGGTVVDPGHDGAVGDVVFAHVPSRQQTMVLLPAHARGTWTVTTDGRAITDVQVIEQARPLKLRARLSRRGATRIIHYTMAAEPGDRVQFSEQGSAGQLIGAPRSARSGTLAFTPAAGRPGGRTIVAEVTRDGLGVGQRLVGRYVVRAPRGLQAVRNLKVATSPGRARVSWTPSPGARGYSLVLRLRRSGVRTRSLKAGAHRATISGLAAGDSGTVRVTPVGALGQKTRAATARLATPRPPRLRLRI